MPSNTSHEKVVIALLVSSKAPDRKTFHSDKRVASSGESNNPNYMHFIT